MELEDPDFLKGIVVDYNAPQLTPLWMIKDDDFSFEFMKLEDRFNQLKINLVYAAPTISS